MPRDRSRAKTQTAYAIKPRQIQPYRYRSGCLPAAVQPLARQLSLSQLPLTWSKLHVRGLIRMLLVGFRVMSSFWGTVPS